jgi:N-acetylglutamate synthase-like GNAT family acetyltransferase
MKVIDLADEHKELFSVCLEDWSEEAKAGGPRRRRWVERSLARGLRAKLAVDDAGTVGGMIQCLPIEQACVQGEGLHFVLCIWVHGHKKGRGDLRGRGMGSALLEAAEADARARGAKGMAAWGLWLPFWMRASWFKRHGYRKADRQGIAALVWKPFAEDARAPRWFPEARKPLERVPGKVAVDAYVNGWCLAGSLVAEHAARAAAEFGDKVVYREVDASDRGVPAAFGFSSALFIDGRSVRTGPPPSYEKIRSLVAKRVARL